MEFPIGSHAKCVSSFTADDADREFLTFRLARPKRSVGGMGDSNEHLINREPRSKIEDRGVTDSGKPVTKRKTDFVTCLSGFARVCTGLHG